MSFPRYPKYKDSGVEWLGEVPEHWDILPLRRSIEFLTDYEANGSFADTKENVAIDTGEPYAWYVRATDLEQRRFGLVEGNRFCDQATFNWLTKTSLRGGELLVAKRGEIGKVYVMPIHGGNATLAPNLYLIRLKRNLQPRYAWYWFSVDPGKAELVLADKSTTIGALYKDDVKACFVTTPSTAEQTRIVEFLDAETGKIDELVAEQKRLMELLKEKRQAVISHAVTKGLNPRAPMKPSGIEWLGDVPAHWNVLAARRIIQRIEQGWSPECFGRPAEGEEWGVLKSGCVNRGVFVEEENKALPETLDPIPEYEIHSGDVLMSRASGSPELVGSTAFITETRARLMLSDKIFRIQPEPNIDRKFFVAAFNSYLLRSQIERAISGAEGLANNLPQSALKSFLFPVPPIGEQQAIIKDISTRCGELGTLAAEAQKAIDLLQERRTALISAAVTGQIDVRKLAAA